LCDPLDKIPPKKETIPTVIKKKEAITRQHWFLVLTPIYIWIALLRRREV
jgi:hypothetical protein